MKVEIDDIQDVIDSFLNTQNDTHKEEWYCTERDIGEEVMEAFISYLKERLGE